MMSQPAQQRADLYLSECSYVRGDQGTPGQQCRAGTDLDAASDAGSYISGARFAVTGGRPIL
jgi:hypothetical protein